MEKFLEKAETATKLGLCIVLALFAIVSVIGTIVEPGHNCIDNNLCDLSSQE